MTSPFDDPKLRAQMAAMGIRHQPGMAADLLKQLAPLLKEDGIDLDDLGAIDQATFTAAFDRAVERHNLSLFTPVGKHRTLSLAVLRTFTVAIADDDQPLAQATLRGVPRDETDDMPAASHVMGTALGLLDTRLSDKAFASVRPRMRVPAWPDKRGTAAARDIVPLANKGRAFDSLDSLLMRHGGGENVMTGAALAVAAAIIAEAQVKGILVPEMATLVLPGDDVVIPDAAKRAPGAARPTSGSAFRRADPGQGSDAALKSEFEAWVRRQPDEDSEGAGEMLGVLLGLASEAELDVRDPDDISEIITEIFEVFEDAPEPLRDNMLYLLDDYLHFQLDVSAHPDAWEEPHAELEDELFDDDADDFSGVLAEALTRGAEVDLEVRYAALLTLPVVAGVRGLLEWVGDSRAVTQTGAVRRTDIADVARPGQPVQVTSMLDLTVLAAWWEALLLADVIELTSTRVRPGRRASEWSGGTDPSRETADLIAGMVAAQILTANAVGFDDEWQDRMLTAVVPAALEALSEEGLALPALTDGDALHYVASHRVAQLAEVGLASQPEFGVVAVPAALVGTVARAVMMLLAMKFGMPEEPGDA